MKRRKILAIVGVSTIVGALVTASLIPAASQEGRVVQIEAITK
jgi:hypothetical protein